MMGLLDSIFGKKETKPKLLTPPWMMANLRELSNAAMPQATSFLETAGQPYPGQLTAAMSPLSQSGLARLEDILGQPAASENPLFVSAVGELQKTLSGEYDPYESEYYDAVRSGLLRELSEAKDRLRASASARDVFSSSGRVAGEGELEETAMNSLAQVLGSLAEAERGRRLGAAGAVPGLLAYGQEASLQPVQAAMTLGDFPRQLEQQGLDRLLGEYARQRAEEMVPLDTAMAVNRYKPEYYQPTYGPSPFTQVMSGLGTLGGTGFGSNLFSGLGSGLGSLLGGGGASGASSMLPSIAMAAMGFPVSPGMLTGGF